jgi:DNA polymerase III epsilon subunit-like protein
MLKKNLIFLDTETTGNDLEKDRLCQVAYKKGSKIETQNFKPPLPISVKAMSVTHITNKMVEKEEEFKKSKFAEKLKIILKENVLVAHNAKFDIAILEKEGFKIDKFICTLRLARYLDENQEIPEYNLQFLRYYYGIEVDVNPHSAEGDVIVLEKIFEHLFALAQKKAPQASEEEIIKRMIDISQKPVLIKKFSFGKYVGEKIEEIVKKDRQYLVWLQKTKKEDGSDEDMIFTLNYFLKKKNKNSLID